jgi:ribosomal protein L29
MKKRDRDEMHGMKPEELMKKANELKKQIASERLNLLTKDVKNRRVARELRKKRAVALTIARQKMLTQGK